MSSNARELLTVLGLELTVLKKLLSRGTGAFFLVALDGVTNLALGTEFSSFSRIFSSNVFVDDDEIGLNNPVN